MTDYEAVEIAEGFGGGERASWDEQVKAWQHLVDTGLAWRLQGWYGRNAANLIAQGIITDPRGR